ncbi:MAG: succinate dehydrogenase, cytochrome b556 subunit [Rickettsiales bacterium]
MTKEQKQRPLSPHLQIYKPQLTSVLSIFHRGTGVFLFFGLIALFWFLALILIQTMGLGLLDVNLLIISDNAIFKIFLTAITFSVYYHMLNGVRHLFWDIGVGFKISTAYKTGYAVLTGALIMTLVTGYYIFVHESILRG